MITKQEIQQLLSDTECYRGVYRVQKELKENGNGEATFDFSLRTAFRVVENISKKYFEEGFGADVQETSRKHSECRNNQKGGFRSNRQMDCY